jgi:hypothetical protein
MGDWNMRNKVEIFLDPADGSLKFTCPSDGVTELMFEALRPFASRLKAAMSVAPRSRLESAKKFLAAALEETDTNVMHSAAIREKGEQAGHAWKTLRRAKDALGVRSIQRDGRWLWMRPDNG